ncbi:MAG: DsrE family protein [Spirosomataceae bacterium]
MRALLTIVCIGWLATATFGQAKQYPYLKNGGGIFEVPEAVNIADAKLSYKVLGEVIKAADKPDSLNPSLDKLARLLNVHIAAGVPAKNLDMVVVIHFVGTPIILSDEAHQKKFGMPNPNTKLINEMAAKGVKFYVCGQSLRARNLVNEARNPNIKVVHAALLALTTFQLKGYALISP